MKDRPLGFMSADELTEAIRTIAMGPRRRSTDFEASDLEVQQALADAFPAPLGECDIAGCPLNAAEKCGDCERPFCDDHSDHDRHTPGLGEWWEIWEGE